MPPRPMSSPTSYRPAKTRGNSSATYRPFTHYRTTTIYHDWPSAVLQPSEPRGQHKGKDEGGCTRLPRWPAPKGTAGHPRDRGAGVVRGCFRRFSGFLAAIVTAVSGAFRTVEPPDGLPTHGGRCLRDRGGRAHGHVRLDFHRAGRLPRALGAFRRRRIAALGGGACIRLARGAGCAGFEGARGTARARARRRLLLPAVRRGVHFARTGGVSPGVVIRAGAG